MKKILVLNDLVSWGKIGGLQLNTILSFKGYDVFFLPTSLISNKFSLKKLALLDNSAYLKDCLNIWQKMKISFDAIFIGYIQNHRQKDIILDFLKKLDNKPYIFLDPIMGDSGSLYKTVDLSIIDIYKDLLEVSNIILPNQTESMILTDKKSDNIYEVLDLLAKDNRKVIITSAKNNNDYFILAKDNNDILKLKYYYIDKKFAGTGDIFDGLFLANFMQDYDFKQALSKTKESMARILKENEKNENQSNDIVIEKYLDLI